MCDEVRLMKEARQIADWLAALPDKLTDNFLKPRETYLTRKNRIAKQKRIVDLREIAKSTLRIYIFKGDIVAWAKEVQAGKDDMGPDAMKELFEEVALGLDDMRKTLSETDLAHTMMATEASTFLGRAANVYRELSNLPNQAYHNEKVVVEIVALLEKANTESQRFIKDLEKERKLLDYTF